MGNGTTDRIGDRIKLITADLKRYVEKRLELLVINVGEQYARWIAESIQKIAGAVLFLGAIIFLLFSLAFFLGALLDSLSLGFVLASLPLFIGGYLLFNLKPKSLTKRLKSEFEEELVGIFKADYDQESEKLITSNKNELIKEKDQDGRDKQANTQRKKEKLRN